MPLPSPLFDLRSTHGILSVSTLLENQRLYFRIEFPDGTAEYVHREAGRWLSDTEFCQAERYGQMILEKIRLTG